MHPWWGPHFSSRGERWGVGIFLLFPMCSHEIPTFFPPSCQWVPHMFPIACLSSICWNLWKQQPKWGDYIYHIMGGLKVGMVFEIAFGFWCCHNVHNDDPNVFLKFPFIYQYVPNSATFYPISFGQSFTLVNYISKPKEKIIWKCVYINTMWVYSIYINIHIKV
jgi:hypothetical protein